VHYGGILHKFIHLSFATLANKTFASRPNISRFRSWTPQGDFRPQIPWNAPFTPESVPHDVLKISPIYVCIVSWEDYCCLRWRLHHYCSEQVDDPWLCWG